MQRTGLKYRKLTVICAIATMLLAQIVTTSVATTSPALTLALVDADLSSESRTLDTFVDDLARFDKRGEDLAKRPSLTRVEFVAYEQQGTDLRRRLSGIQSALSASIRKLKAAGQWDNLDQIVLATIRDSEFQGFVRNEGFKKTLEEAATGLSSDANQIVSPRDVLRNKVQGKVQDDIFERGNSPLAARAVRVAFTTAPAMFATSPKCRLAQLRKGFSGAFDKHGEPSERAKNGTRCYCAGQQAACDALAQAQ